MNWISLNKCEGSPYWLVPFFQQFQNPDQTLPPPALWTWCLRAISFSTSFSFPILSFWPWIFITLNKKDLIWAVLDEFSLSVEIFFYDFCSAMLFVVSNLHVIQKKHAEASHNYDSWWSSKLNCTDNIFVSSYKLKLSHRVEMVTFHWYEERFLVFELRVWSHISQSSAAKPVLVFMKLVYMRQLPFWEAKKSIQYGTETCTFSSYWGFIPPLFSASFKNCSHLHHNILHDTKNYIPFPQSSV